VLRTVALGTRKVDGVILDSLVSLQDDAKADLSRRSLVADAVGRQVLADCDADPVAARTWASRPNRPTGGYWRARRRSRKCWHRSLAAIRNASLPPCSMCRRSSATFPT